MGELHAGLGVTWSTLLPPFLHPSFLVISTYEVFLVPVLVMSRAWDQPSAPERNAADCFGPGNTLLFALDPIMEPSQGEDVVQGQCGIFYREEQRVSSDRPGRLRRCRSSPSSSLVVFAHRLHSLFPLLASEEDTFVLLPTEGPS